MSLFFCRCNYTFLTFQENISPHPVIQTEMESSLFSTKLKDFERIPVGAGAQPTIKVKEKEVQDLIESGGYSNFCLCFFNSWVSDWTFLTCFNLKTFVYR